MNFAAIDFETANHSLGSVCALGLVVVEAGQVVKEVSRLVRPKELYFDPFNIRIHGITPDHVKDEPEFDELWRDILPLLEGRTVIAHNAAFDINVLKEVLRLYDLPYPEISHSCTCNISRKVWPDLVNHKLNTVARHLGITFKHHDALEDALACARIAIKACEIHNVDTIEELTKKLRIGTSLRFEGRYRPYFDPVRYPDPKAITPETTDFDRSHPFFNSVCVFTGTLKTMSRRDAMQQVVNCGGKCSNSVTKGTRYLILGRQDPAAEGRKSSKFRKVEQLIREGLDIQVLEEEEFLELLNSKTEEVV